MDFEKPLGEMNYILLIWADNSTQRTSVKFRHVFVTLHMERDSLRMVNVNFDGNCFHKHKF